MAWMETLMLAVAVALVVTMICTGQIPPLSHPHLHYLNFPTTLPSFTQSTYLTNNTIKQ